MAHIPVILPEHFVLGPFDQCVDFVAERSQYSTNARQWIVLQFLEQPLTANFGPQNDLGSGPA